MNGRVLQLSMNEWSCAAGQHELMVVFDMDQTLIGTSCDLEHQFILEGQLNWKHLPRGVKAEGPTQQQLVTSLRQGTNIPPRELRIVFRSVLSLQECADGC